MERLTAIPLKPSRFAFYLHNAVLLLAVVALWLSGLPFLYQLLCTGVLLLVAIRQHRHNRRPPINIIDFEKIELVNEQLVLSWLIVLNCRVKEPGEKNSSKKFALALWPDMAHADDLRRLRVFLKNN